VQYQIALDFSGNYLGDMQLEVSKLEKGKYQLTFTPLSSVQSYALYYTNWEKATQKVPASGADVFYTMPPFDNNFYAKLELTSLSEEDCPTSKEDNKVYSCSSKVVYVLQSDKLVAEVPYLFGLAAVKDGKEAVVEEFEYG